MGVEKVKLGGQESNPDLPQTPPQQIDRPQTWPRVSTQLNYQPQPVDQQPVDQPQPVDQQPVDHQPVDHTMINGIAIYVVGNKTALYPVVFVPGLGDGHESWNGKPLGTKSIQHEIAKITHTLSYDPVGIGMSAITPSQIKPTSFKQECTQLRQLIVSAGIDFPVILVGHCIGGRIAGLYANMFPTDVAKLLLINPTPDYQFSNITDGAKLGHAYNINRNYIASYIRTCKQLPKTSPHCKTILHDRTVLDRIKDSNLKQFNKSFYHDIYKHITHIDGDHYIQFGNPDSIIYSINELLGQLKASK